MLTSNLWNEVGKGKVVDLVYTNSEWLRNGGVPESVVVKIWDLAENTYIESFLEGCEQSLTIPMK